MTWIAVLLAVVLAAGVWGVRELAEGAEARRALVARGDLNDSERRARTPSHRLDARIRRTVLGRQAARQIAGAGLRVRVATFLLMLAGSVSVAVVAVGVLLGPVFGLAAAAVVCLSFFGYLRRQEARRREEFIGQLPELARVLSNATAAGLAIRTAVEMAAEELDDPARVELARTAEAMRVGQPFEEAMRDLAERLPSRELTVLVSTLVVSARSGGSLISALRNISMALEDRKETRREVRTIIGQAVVSGWAVAAMGAAMLVMMNVLVPGSVRAMTGSLLGVLVLGVGCGLLAAGVVLIRRITRIDV
ncbi:type II secretion system F family protein [Actinoallomurus iriomotensis]|uniref:Membrane protein n=1 Tax=Actinoallomurus iriomotensis TaxID=478107 RepID=A0A9W6VU85_9ACTN|nr:type II secretion system F family protein [Actinoallomurus iriomotensis]GLY85313.1 membrane protein [Actinoallomurus iriomotensis]